MRSPTPSNFRAFGKLIDYPGKDAKGKKRNLWRIVHTEHRRVGWRIAYLVLRDKTIGRMECHPDSDESFEPVRGLALMFVAAQKDPAFIHCFKLDKPLLVNKGVWHAVVTLTPQTEIKITENAKVRCVYWPLEKRISRPSDLEGMK